MADGVPTECARVLRGHHGPVNAVRFNEKGTYVMTCGQDKTIRLWNPHRDGLDAKGEGLLVKTYQGRHGYDVQDVAISQDNGQFASCGRDKAVFLWDVPTGKVIRKFEGHEHSINCVRYNNDSSVLLSASYDKTVRAWDIRARNSFAPIQILDEFKDSVTSLIVSGHEIIAGCVDGLVRTFDLRAGMVYRDNIEEPVISVARSPDGRQVLASALDGAIRLIDRATGNELKKYRGHRMDEYKIECAFSNDGAYALSGSEDGDVYHWDVVSARMSRFHAHGKPLRALAYHPEDSMLITACVAGSVKVWTGK